MAQWKVGQYGRDLFRDGRYVGTVDTPALAAEIVETMNRVGRLLDAVREWAGPGDALCELYAGHCPGCACVLPAGHPGEYDIHCGQPQRPRDAERRSEATPQKDLPPGPLNRSLHFGPSRVDPYDTTKGYTP